MGRLNLGAGIYGWVNLPPAAERVALWHLHADVWWGAFLFAFGLVYVLKFRPSKNASLTGA